jgi:hypothetical protein
VHLRARAEVDEQAEEVRRRGRAAGRVGEGVHHRQRAAWRQCLVGLAEQGGDLVRAQVVHEVEAEHRVVATTRVTGAQVTGAQVSGAQVSGGRVAVPEPHPVGHPGRGDDLAADRRTARQVEHGRGQPRVAAAQRRRVQAVAAADVEQLPRA